MGPIFCWMTMASRLLLLAAIFAAVSADTPEPVGANDAQLRKVYANSRANPLPPIGEYALPVNDGPAESVAPVQAKEAPKGIFSQVIKRTQDTVNETQVALNGTTIEEPNRKLPEVTVDKITDEHPLQQDDSSSGRRRGCKKKNSTVPRCPGPDCGPADDLQTNMAARNEHAGGAIEDPSDDCWEDVPVDVCTPAPLDSTVDTMRDAGVWNLYSRVRAFADCVVCTDLVGQLPDGFSSNDCAVYNDNAKVAKGLMDKSRDLNAPMAEQDASAKKWSNARESARACNALLPKFSGSRSKLLDDYNRLDMTTDYAKAKNKATVMCKQLKCCSEIF